MTTVAELIELAPAPAHGTRTQARYGTGEWRLCVEIADPSAGSSIEWHDITGPVASIRWRRGSNEPRGRYVGTSPVVEIWADDDRYAPWNPDTSPTFGVHVPFRQRPYMRAAIFRVVGGVTNMWFPLWTGRVRGWRDAQAALGNVRFHRVDVVDFVTELVNAPLAGQVQENWSNRLVDHFADAGWQYGLDIYGAETDDEDGSGIDPSILLDTVDAQDSAIAAIDLTADSAGVVWRTRPSGRAIVHPPPWDTFHASKFAGAFTTTGDEWVNPLLAYYPNGVIFSFLPVDDQVPFYPEVDGQSFGIDSDADGIINELRVTYPDGMGGTTPYSYDDPVSAGVAGRRPLAARSWLTLDSSIVEELVQAQVDAQAYTDLIAAPLRTNLDEDGAFPAIALLDQFDPVTTIHSTRPGRQVITVVGPLRAIEHVIVPRIQDERIEWDVSAIIDVDQESIAEALLPVENLAIVAVDETYAEWSWTNPTQTITPTETQVRIIQQGSQWIPIVYPTTGFAWLGIDPSTTYTFEVRLVRRVDDVITNVSPARSISFITDEPTVPVPVPGGDGSVVIIPDPPEEEGCEVEWRMEESDDGGETWTTVRSGDETDFVYSEEFDALILDNSDYTFIDNYLYRECVRWDCGDGFGAWQCQAVSYNPNCSTPAALSTAPYDDASMQVFVPKICGDEILEAVSGVAGYRGPAFGAITNASDDAFALAADAATSGLVAYGAAAIDNLTGDASIGITVSLGTVPDTGEIIGLWQCAGIHIEAVRASSTTWTPRAKFFTAGGGSATISGDPLDLDTEYVLLVTHDVSEETGTLYVDDAEVAQTTTTGVRINALPVWVMALPADSYATSAAVWSSVMVPADPAPSTLTVVGSVTNALLNDMNDLDSDGSYCYVVTTDDRLVIVAVTTPASPSISGSVTNGSTLNAAFGVVKDGGYAYVSSTTYDGLTVVDVTNKAAPSIVGQVTNSVLNAARYVVKDGSYCYVTAELADRLVVIDVSTPASPSIVGSVTNALLNSPRALVKDGSYCYVTSNADNRVTVVDVSNPAAPSVVGSVTDATNLVTPSSIAKNGNVLYVRGTNRLTTVDVSNPASPAVISSFTDALITGSGEVFYDAGFCYVAANTADSLVAIDVSNPASMSIVASVVDATNLNGAASVVKVGDYCYVAARDSDRVTVVEVA
jgi:hypothetical protein